MTSKKRIIASVFVALSLVAIVFMKGRLPIRRADAAADTASTEKPTSKPLVTTKPLVKGQVVSPDRSPNSDIHSRLVTLRPSGFEPSEITGPAGRWLLLVDNRSGTPEMWLRLDRVTGRRLHEIRVPHETLDWHDLFDLTPGEYVLTDTHHPDFACHITVTPK
jgi:hypothetical protein